MGIFDFFKREEQLVGKVKLDNIYCCPSPGRKDDCGYYIAYDPRYKNQSVLTINNSVHEQWTEDKKGRAQGAFQLFSFAITDKKLLPNQEELGKTPDGKILFRYLREKGEYKNDELVGIITRYNRDGSVEDYLRPQNYGSPFHGTIKSGDSVKNEWKEKVEALKVEKEMDKPARSATLKKVLEAGTKKGKKEALKKFHKQKSPAGFKRRTGLKFDR